MLSEHYSIHSGNIISFGESIYKIIHMNVNHHIRTYCTHGTVHIIFPMRMAEECSLIVTSRARQISKRSMPFWAVWKSLLLCTNWSMQRNGTMCRLIHSTVFVDGCVSGIIILVCLMLRCWTSMRTIRTGSNRLHNKLKFGIAYAFLF